MLNNSPLRLRLLQLLLLLLLLLLEQCVCRREVAV